MNSLSSVHVFLIHGFLNRGWIMRSPARALERAGFTCHTPSLKPCDGRGGLPALAVKLEALIAETVPAGEPLVLVGFSMGALICREYLQTLGGHRRCAAFFTIAGPHSGTKSASFYPSEGVRQMRPGSEFLVRLAATENVLEGIPVTNFWTPYDFTIRPVESCCWRVGETIRIPALNHSLLLFHRGLHRELVRRAQAVGGQSLL